MSEEKLMKRLKPFNLQHELFPWQKEVLIDIHEKLSQMRDNPGKLFFRYQFVGAYGVGKTYLLCIVMIQYMLYCAANFPDKTFKGVVFSGTGAQLSSTLWFDIKNILARADFADSFFITSQKIFIKNFEDRIECTARNIPQSYGSKIAGMHADNVLTIFDEATTIPEYIFDKAATFYTQCNGLWLVSGNGERTDGRFYQNFNEDKYNDWINRNVSRFDLGLEHDAYIESVLRDYGEESDYYKVNVLGEFTESSGGYVFPEHILEAATSRWTGMPAQHVIFSADVASGHGQDFSTLVVRSASRVVQVYKMKVDLTEFVQFVKSKVREYHPQAIVVDEIGCGQGVFEALAAFYGSRIEVVPMQCGMAANNSKFFANKRAELFMQARDFMKKYGSIPADKDLLKELRSIQFIVDRLGRTQIKSKEKNEKSPDMADALAYSFAVEPEAIMSSRYKNFEALSMRED